MSSTNNSQGQDFIVFNNLRAGSALTNESKPLEINVPKSFIAPNAPGVFRQVESYKKVAEIAGESAKRHLYVFSSLDK